MGLINFNEIDFKKSIDKTNKIINFNGSEIRITNYLSTYDKYDLIMVTLQKSFEDGIYNIIKMNTYFELHLIYLYTNIVFSAEDRADEVELYDTMKKSGLIDLVKNAIGEKEIEELYSRLRMTASDMLVQKNSASGRIFEMIDGLSDKLKNMLKELKDVNPELVEKIMTNFKAATAPIQE